MGDTISLYYDDAKAIISNIKEVNSSFATASLRIMYTDENRNKTNISRASVEQALPTLYNVPIVCNWDPVERTIGGHDIQVFKDADGNMRVRELTVPCGVITDHTTFSFAVEADENGAEHEYLIADGVVLWKRQDVYEFLVNDCNGTIAHSMEIEVSEGGKNADTGYYDVKSFEFTALCLLGEGHTPCFEGSRLQIYSDMSVKQEIAAMMAELKECYTMIVPADSAANNKEKAMEGGEGMTEEKIEVVAEETVVETETTEKFEEAEVAADAEVDDVESDAENFEAEETAESDTEAEEATEFELSNNMRDVLCKAICEQKFVDRWGDERPAYFMEDFDEAVFEVYATSHEDWNLYGFKYSMDNDAPVIDWESKTRKKFAIVDFNEGDTPAPTSAETVYEEMATALESARAALEDARKYSEVADELEALREFKASAESAERTEVVNAVFERFSDLSGNDAFEALRLEMAEDNTKYDAEALEEKCYALRGRLGTKAKFSIDTQAPKIKVEHDSDADATSKPYGGIVEKYLG